jgi:hypothetical protein
MLRGGQVKQIYDSNSLQAQRPAAIRRLAQRLRLALSQAEEFAHQIKDLAWRRFPP